MLNNNSLYDIIEYKDQYGNLQKRPRTNKPFVVSGGKIDVGEILVQLDHVYITGLNEIPLQQQLISSTQFKVDYTNGVIYFYNSSQNGNTLNLSFYASGQKNVKAINTTLIDADNNFAIKDAENALLDLANRISNLTLNTTNPAQVTDALVDGTNNITYSNLKQRLDQNKAQLLSIMGDVSELLNYNNMIEAINDKAPVSIVSNVNQNTNDITTLNTNIATIPKFLGQYDTTKLLDVQTLIQNRQTYGTKNNAVVMAIQSNKTPDVEILGINQPSDLATYSNRDSVAIYLDATGTDRDVYPIVSVTTTTLELSNINSIAKLKIGSIIDLTSQANLDTNDRDVVESNKYSGIVTNIDTVNNKTIVSGWFKIGNTSSNQLPTGVDRAIINPINKIWGINNNVFLYESNHTDEAVADEIGLFNYKAHGRMGGLDVVGHSINGTNLSFGYQVRKDVGAFAFNNGFIADGCINGFYAGADMIKAFVAGNGDFEVDGAGTIKALKVKQATYGNTSVDINLNDSYVNFLVPNTSGLTFKINNNNLCASFIVKVFSLNYSSILQCNQGNFIKTDGVGNTLNIPANKSVELYSDGTNWYVM